MKAWLLDSIGTGIASLRLGKLPDPTPAPGEAVLELSLAALNPADRYLADGLYPAKPQLPHVLGRDGLGTITAVSPDVTGVKLGDRRIIVRSEIGVSRRGTFAGKVAVPVESLVPVPEGWSDEQAAGATLVYLTAWQAMEVWPDLPTNAVVMVSGATGGVGVACTQLASAMGHVVIALSRSPRKSAELREQGAALTLQPDPDNLKHAIREFLGHRRVDLVIDNIGGELFTAMLDTLGENGRVSCVGRLAGPVPNFNTASLFFRRLQIRGIGVYAYKPAQSAAIWPQIVATLARRNYTPLVDSVHEFENLPAAFQRLADGPMGKVLLRITDEARRS